MPESPARKRAAARLTGPRQVCLALQASCFRLHASCFVLRAEGYPPRHIPRLVQTGQIRAANLFRTARIPRNRARVWPPDTRGKQMANAAVHLQAIMRVESRECFRAPAESDGDLAVAAAGRCRRCSASWTLNCAAVTRMRSGCWGRGCGRSLTRRVGSHVLGAGVRGAGAVGLWFESFLRPSVMVVPVRGSGWRVCLSAAGFRVHDPAPPQASSTPAGLNQGLDQNQEPKQDQRQEHKQDQRQEHKQDQQQEHKQDQGQELW